MGSPPAFRFGAAYAFFLPVLVLAAGCSDPSGPDTPPATREGSIPEDAVKMTPEDDLFPPVLHSQEWLEPVPIPGPLNTAGVEDAPVVSADGSILYFFFTPDASVPAEEQLFDGVTGIWWCQAQGGSWTEPVRAVLASDISLDGPMSLQGDTLWFASIRQGCYMDDGDIFRAWMTPGGWNWMNAGELLNLHYNIGECAVTQDGSYMVCARGPEYGEYGGYDLWELNLSGAEWEPPANLGGDINSPADDGQPAISPDGSELFFTSASTYGYSGPSVFRSVRSGAEWSPPEEIVSNFCGDPAVDMHGNLYFTHVFADSTGQIIETDIYIAARN